MIELRDFFISLLKLKPIKNFMIKKIKKILNVVYFIMLLSINNLQANNINDFQIEGLSLGDSLYNHLSKNEISKNQEFIYSNDKNFSNEVAAIQYIKNLKLYDQLQISFKVTDPKLSIIGISGYIAYENDLDSCYKKQEEIFKDLKDYFGNIQTFKGGFEDHPGYPKGEMKLKRYSLYLSNTKRSNLEIICFDAKNFVDRLSVSLKSDNFNDWLIKLNK